MTRFVAPAVLMALLAAPAGAADPGAGHATRKAAPRVVAKPNPILQLMAAAEARERWTIREAVASLQFLVCPQPRFDEFVRWKKDEDLRRAREEIHRFWMNNQPSVLTYERLPGAIGP